MLLRSVALALALASLAHAAPAPPAPVARLDCPVPVGASPLLAGIDGRLRLEFVRARFAHAARRGWIWSYAWGGFLALATVAPFALSPLYPADGRIDLYLTGGKAFVGLLSLIVLPHPVLREHRRLEARLAAAGDADPCAQLADAERSLERAADGLQKGAALLSATAMLFNIAVAIVQGLVFHRWDTAVLGLFVGAAVGQTLFATKPSDAIEALAAYRAGRLGAPAPVTRWQLLPLLSRDQASVTLSVPF